MENNEFWFMMIDGERVNVIRMDDAIMFHYWDDTAGSWIQDNGLFDMTLGPDRSTADAVRTDEVTARAWLTENTNWAGQTESIPTTRATVPNA